MLSNEDLEEAEEVLGDYFGIGDCMGSLDSLLPGARVMLIAHLLDEALKLPHCCRSEEKGLKRCDLEFIADQEERGVFDEKIKRLRGPGAKCPCFRCEGRAHLVAIRRRFERALDNDLPKLSG